MSFIIDCSVAIKWFVAEEGQNAAEALIGEALIAPDLLLPEISNVVWKKWRIKEIGQEQAQLALQAVLSFVELVPASGFADRALEIAIELDHPAYDCFYLALSEFQGVPLVTADGRLIRRCAETRFAKMLKAL